MCTSHSYSHPDNVSGGLSGLPLVISTLPSRYGLPSVDEPLDTVIMAIEAVAEISAEPRKLGYLVDP